MIEEKMLSLRDESQVKGLSRFFKTGPGQYGEGDLFLGIKVPVTRSVVKEIWRECSFEDLESSIASPWHEVRLCSLLVLIQIYKHSRKDKDLQRRCVEFYLSHTGSINNWDLVDLSCYEILGDWLLDKKDRSILYDLAGNGKTIWEKRIGIVSCMQFIRHGSFEDAIAISDILLHHPHDLIHKAVGWLLRDIGKRDETLLRNYLESPAPGEHLPRCATMPRTMLRYAIEKFPEQDRQLYMSGNPISSPASSSVCARVL